MNKPIQVEQTPVDALIPFARNARTHSDEQVKQIAASIREFGFNNPILIRDDLTVIAGHGRLAAAKVLGLKEVPTISLAHLTPLQVRAYVLADNKLALNAGWDDEMLALELQELALEGFDAALTGFDEVEIGALLADKTEEGLTDEDEVPETPEEPTTKLGYIWICGHHRVMCEDSTSIDSVDKLLMGEKAEMVFTDPPYNIGYKGTMSRTTVNGVQVGHVTASARHDEIANDKMTENEFRDFMVSVISIISLRCHGSWYVCFGSQTLDLLLSPLRQAGMVWKSIIIWRKEQSTISAKDYKSMYEPIVYGRFGDDFFGERYHERDVWEFNRTKKNDLHPTMKPIELVANALSHGSAKGHVVLDLFGGSGSTMIACEKTGRASRLMELNPHYCDVIVKRWQDFTGKKATLESNGKTFDELKAK